VLAVKGRDGCESLLKYAENEKEEVVGSVNGKGMMRGLVKVASTVFWRDNRVPLTLPRSLVLGGVSPSCGNHFVSQKHSRGYL
jgi:hypothetical protein